MRKVRFGLLGASRIADNSFAPAVKKARNSSLIAVAARELKKAERFAKKHHIPYAYGSYEEMLKNPSVDAVYISLPNHLHAYWGKKTLEAGKHVIIEKPITNSTRELEALYSIAEKKKLVVMEAFMFLYNDRFNKTLEMIRTGEMGKVKTVHADFSISLKDKKNIRYMDEPGSGGLADLGTYTNMLAEQIMGTWPEYVDCRLVKLKPGHHADIHYTAMMGFSEGRTAVISGDMDSQTTVEAFIVCEKGTIFFNDFLLSGRILPIQIRTGSKRKKRLVLTRNHYVQEVEDMVEAITKGKTLKASKKITINHRKVLDLCLESARLEKSIKVPKKFYI